MNGANLLDPAPALRFAVVACHRTGLEPTDANVADKLGTTQRAVQRYRNEGARLTRPRADRYAIRLGHHPLNLWPDF